MPGIRFRSSSTGRREVENHERNRGFTLLETLVAMVLLLGMTSVLMTLTSSSGESQKFASEIMKTLEANQDVLTSIDAALSSSVLLVTNTPTGQAYKDLIDLSGCPPLLASRLPMPRADNAFDKEKAGELYTGNLLFFAEQYRTDTFLCSSGNRYRNAVVRLHAYYLSSVDDGPTPGKPYGLNLSHWVSEPIADAADIDRIADPADQAEVLQHLLAGTADADGATHPRMVVVWKIGEDPSVAGTLRSIKSGGTMMDTPPASRGSTWKILGDSALQRTDLLSFRGLSVATNYADARFGVSRFSQMDTTGAGFPHGFEIQISGPVSSRMVLVRLVVVRAADRERLGFSHYHIVAYTSQGRTT